MEKIIRLTAHAEPVHDARGSRNGNFTARFKGLKTLSSHSSPASALAEIATRISARCEDQSTYVNVVPIRGHVGVFSLDLNGYVQTSHAWPDGHVSVSLGAKDMREAEDCFRLHVAQVTWEGTLPESSDILPADTLAEFRSWASFQLAYRHATGSKEMESVPAHTWACEHSRQFLKAQ